MQRNSDQSYFVTVPEGAKALQVDLGGLATGSQTRFIAIHPYGVPVDSTSTLDCYTNYTDANGVQADVAFVREPAAGRLGDRGRVAPYVAAARQPVQADAAVQGVTFDPAAGRSPRPRPAAHAGLLEGDEQLRSGRRAPLPAARSAAR